MKFSGVEVSLKRYDGQTMPEYNVTEDHAGMHASCIVLSELASAFSIVVNNKSGGERIGVSILCETVHLTSFLVEAGASETYYGPKTTLSRVRNLSFQMNDNGRDRTRLGRIFVRVYPSPACSFHKESYIVPAEARSPGEHMIRFLSDQPSIAGYNLKHIKVNPLDEEIKLYTEFKFEFGPRASLERRKIDVARPKAAARAQIPPTRRRYTLEEEA